MADATRDLEMLKRIKIHNYCWKDGGAKQKGVIAQEVAELMPEIVHETRGFVPSICKQGRVTSRGKIALYGLDPGVVGDLYNEKYLRIFIGGKRKDVALLKITEKKNAVFIKVGVPLTMGNTIFVYGPLTSCKTVDKDYLFMMLFNAVKALAA